MIIIASDTGTRQYLHRSPLPKGKARQTPAPYILTSDGQLGDLSPSFLPRDKDSFFGLQMWPLGLANPSKVLVESGSPFRKSSALQRTQLPQLKRLWSEPWGLRAPSGHHDERWGACTGISEHPSPKRSLSFD